MESIEGADCLWSRSASAFDKMPTIMEQGGHGRTSPFRGYVSHKRDAVIPHLSWYPDYASADCGIELKTLLVKSRLDGIYSRIDWEWHTASNINHFLCEARVIHRGRIEDTSIEYTPRGCRTPIHITMEKMARCLGLDLDGLFFDSASADEVNKQQTYFGPMKRSPLKGEYYFDLHTAGTKALTSVGRFAVNVIYLGEGESCCQVSLICMKHLQCALAGKPVAWGKVLWEQLLRSIRVYQTLLKWQLLKKDCIRKAHFSALLLALLFRVEYEVSSPRIKVRLSAFKSTRRAENGICSRYHSLMAKPVDYDQEHDSADNESRDGINAESLGLIQDMTDSYYKCYCTEKAMADQLAKQDKERKSSIYNRPQPGTHGRIEEHGRKDNLSTKLYVFEELKVPLKYISHPPARDGISGAMVEHLTQQGDDELQVQKPKVSHLQGGSKIVGCTNDRHGKSSFNEFYSSRSVSKPFHGQTDVRRYHDYLMMRARKHNMSEIMGGAGGDATLNPMFVAHRAQAWQQSKFKTYNVMESMFSRIENVDDDVLQLTQNLLQSFEPYAETKQKVDEDVGTSGLITDESQSGEFQSFLHQIQESETSKAENVQEDVPQLTQNLLQSFESSIEKEQKVQDEDVCPSGLIQSSQTLQNFTTCFTLENRLEQAAEINGKELYKHVEDPRTSIRLDSVQKNPALRMTSDDVKVISNLLKEQEKLITNLTEKATELKEYVCGENRKFCSLSDTVEQKDLEIDVSKGELKLVLNKNLELEQSIENLRAQANVMEQELTLYKTITDQLKEHKKMVANLTNENSTLKRKMESMEKPAENTKEKAESTDIALSSVGNVFKRLKASFR